jgi:hypothetical protein
VKRRPNYVRAWIENKKRDWKNFFTRKMVEAKARGIIDDIFDARKSNLKEHDMKKLGFIDDDGELSFKDPTADDDVSVEDLLSDEEDELKELKGKNLNHVYNKPKNFTSKQIDNEGYFNRILKYEFDQDSWHKLVDDKNYMQPHKIKDRFELQQQQSH